MTGDGWRLVVHDELGSTSDEVIAAAEAGASAGLAVLARRQTRARGSRGRSWTEPPRGNLAVSVLLRPELRTDALGLVALRAGLALFDALRPHAGRATLALKWPNDVLLDGRKLAGILVESAAGDRRIGWLVIGFGANLRERPALPGGPATACLAEGGAPAPQPEVVASLLLDRIDHWWSREAGHVRESWLARTQPVGSALLVGGVPGRFGGLAPSGALVFEGPEGRREISAGEVFAPVLARGTAVPT